MNKFISYDDELEYLSALLLVHNHNRDVYTQKKIVALISDWFDENSSFIAHLDIGLHQTINNILDDGIITDEECDTLTAYVKQYLRSHKQIDYMAYKDRKQRLSHAEKMKIILNNELDKDFIDKVCVITGDFSKFPNYKEAEREIYKRGGKTASSISGSTNILICGSNAGWKKIHVAKQRIELGQNILLIDEKIFYKMLESNEAIEG